MKVFNRIMAVTKKEWRLNFRFPLEYLAANVVSPVKSAVLLYLLYRGFLKDDGQQFGLLNKGSFPIFILVGTTCHSLFTAALQTFRFKMVTEKYWQTIPATLVAPASIFEVIVGYILGSVGIHLLVSAIILGSVSFFYSIPIQYVFVGMFLILFVCAIGFGLGLLGATMTLVWEGKTFVFDYSMQALTFLSCFYYPIEAIPQILQPLIRVLPTYRATMLIQSLFIQGSHAGMATDMLYLAAWAAVILVLPAFFLEYSVKRWGIVGY